MVELFPTMVRRRRGNSGQAGAAVGGVLDGRQFVQAAGGRKVNGVRRPIAVGCVDVGDKRADVGRVERRGREALFQIPNEQTNGLSPFGRRMRTATGSTSAKPLTSPLVQPHGSSLKGAKRPRRPLWRAVPTGAGPTTQTLADSGQLAFVVLENPRFAVPSHAQPRSVRRAMSLPQTTEEPSRPPAKADTKVADVPLSRKNYERLGLTW